MNGCSGECDKPVCSKQKLATQTSSLLVVVLRCGLTTLCTEKADPFVSADMLRSTIQCYNVKRRIVLHTDHVAYDLEVDIAIVKKIVKTLTNNC